MLDATKLLHEVFGKAGSLTRLPGENQNYLIEQPDGERIVLKILESDYAVEAEVERLATKALSKLGLNLPLELAESPAHNARLFAFVPGTPWCDAGKPSPVRCQNLGSKIAEISQALAPIESKAARRTHDWDLTQAHKHRALIPFVEGRAQRQMVDRALHEFAAYRIDLDELPQGLIHGDMNDENVLLDGDQISGLLDFGDSLVNPLVCELAIALAYAMQNSDEPLHIGAEVVAGYKKVRSISEEESRVVVPLIRARLAVSIVMAAQRRTIDPDRDSWFSTEPNALKLLESLSNDPSHTVARALGLEVGPTGAPAEELLKRRTEHINPALSVAYDEPLKIQRGRGQFLFAEDGRAYLDMVNNVCHVGHCHPQVVTAGQKQMAELNTNTRYLYDGLSDYADRLCATFPEELDTCFFVNSGSEANELALRLASAHTGRDDVLVVDGAYHGHTSKLIAISPYKFMGKGGSGKAEPWVHVVPLADGYRGTHKGQGSDAGQAYADDLQKVIEESSRPIGAFICESLLGCGGQVVPPDGYMSAAFEKVRAQGGVCIADEVQVGFGRVGSHFWAFERQGVVPDIVVLGKPIGNGHPMAAVVAKREIAESFANGMEFFATFGGNPVSCAIGMAVLDVIENEGLQQHTLELGEYFKQQLEKLAERHEAIGEVRGVGLFLGVELVLDRATLEPAAELCADVVNRMRQHGVLLSTDGPLHNVIKIKPPMVITSEDVDMVVRLLDEVLGTTA